MLLDRGKPVQPRRRDLKALNQQGLVDSDSNYCFGEGGAGTYSDGKLYTRSHKRGNVRDVIEVLALHGAPSSILVDARPHIGSNLLPQVVTAIRERLESVGVEIRFGARVIELVVDAVGGRRRIAGVRLADGSEIGASVVVLATGHSARDVFDMLVRAGVSLEPKPFAIGVRIEHPQPLVNRIQYGRAAGHPKLPAAAYRLVAEVEARGVFSFCMCPGGWVVPASTEVDGLVVNGMSLSRRDSPFANSGLVVAVELEDLAGAGLTGPLAGVELQRRVEREALQRRRRGAGRARRRAPLTSSPDEARARCPSRATCRGSPPATSRRCSTSRGSPSPIACVGRSREFDRRMRGYLSEEAVLIGVESRTSCPVRVPRHPESLESMDLGGLYPAGEGAGFAGGIVSAAVDGLRIGEQIARRFELSSPRASG